MAQSISASALVNAQAAMEEYFASPNPTKYAYYKPAFSANAFLRNTSALTSAAFDSFGKFTGVNVYFFRKGSTSITHNGTVDAATQACDIGEGVGPTTAAKSYTNEVKIISKVEVQDDFFGNVRSVEEAIAERQMAAMADLRDAIDTRVINFLVSNKTTVNTDTALPDGITFNAGTNTFDVDRTTVDVQNPDGLTELDRVAMGNDLGEYYYLTGGSNFYSAMKNAQYRVQNDNERNLIAFQDYELYADPRMERNTNLSGIKPTFAVGKNTYAAWDYIHSGLSTTPVEVGPDRYEYYVSDPNLLINDNGTIRPIRYSVRYTRECSGVNKLVNRETYMHRWEISYTGNIILSPQDTNSHTGILMFDAQGV